MPLLKLKVNTIAWLEFELAYYDSVVHFLPDGKTKSVPGSANQDKRDWKKILNLHVTNLHVMLKDSPLNPRESNYLLFPKLEKEARGSCSFRYFKSCTFLHF